MEQLMNLAGTYLNGMHMPAIRSTDIVEIIILSFLVYQMILWIKNTHAWSLLKGLIVILVFILLAAVFNMTTILWIAQNVLSLAVIAIVVVLQPELRRALEQLGRTNFFASLIILRAAEVCSRTKPCRRLSKPAMRWARCGRER